MRNSGTSVLPTLVHGNSTIEISERNRAQIQADILHRFKMERSREGTKEKMSRWPNCLSGLLINYFTNITEV